MWVMRFRCAMVAIVGLCLSMFSASEVAGGAAGGGDQKGGSWAASYTDDLSKNYRLTTPCRDQVSLNGIWKISIQEKPQNQAPASDWGYGLVPSNWVQPVTFPLEGLADLKVGAWDGECRYKGKTLRDYASAWYERSFVVPADWQGSRVHLAIDRVSITGTVFLNDQLLGTQDDWDSRDWDVTSLVKYGQSNRLLVRVDALVSGDITLYLGAEQTRQVKATAHVRGISQDVWLKRLPSSVRIQEVFVHTSVRKQSLGLEVELANPQSVRGKAQLQAVVTELSGDAPVKTIVGPSVELTGQPTQTMTLSESWPQVRLWEMDDPHRYRLTVSLQVDGRQVDQLAPQTFGFRELWTQGRNLLLNGKPVHLIFMAYGYGQWGQAIGRQAIDRQMRAFRLANFNAIQLASESVQRHGTSAEYYREILDYADENGLLVAMPLTSVTAVDWNTSAGQADWQRAIRSLVKRYRNHPSLALWSMNFNLLGYPWDMNPYAWADGYRPDDRLLGLGDKRKKAAASEQFVHSLDSTRPIYHHAGGHFGQFLTSNFYLSWAPMQEREDYPAGWASRGDKPLMTVEHGVPCQLDFQRGRVGDYETIRWTEMLEDEYAAMFFGSGVYARQTDEYLGILSRNATDQKQNDADKYNVNQAYFWGYAMRPHEPLVSLYPYLYGSYLRGWRAYGVTGFCPHDGEASIIGRFKSEPWMGHGQTLRYPDLTAPGHKPMIAQRDAEHEKRPLTLYGQAMRKTNAPLLLFVGGDEADGMTAKDHAYFSGQNISKRLVLVNDLRRDLSLTIPWKLLDDAAAVVAQGQATIQAAAGTTGFGAIELQAPAVGQRRRYQLVCDEAPLKTAAKEAYCHWPLEIQVWPPASGTASAITGPILLIDPDGQTTAMLRKLAPSAAVTLSQDGHEAGSAKLIVLGRNALAKGRTISPAVIQAVDQGATLVCFEQPTLQPFGLRTHDRGVRQVFPLVSRHPVVADLTPVDLENWRRDASLLNPWPTPQQDDLYPTEPWRYGNRGTVCGVMIEKPSSGGLWPLMECEYDLGYTPLLEGRQGKGRILFCQLEVTLRYGIDPVATQIADRLLAYAAQPVSSATGAVMASNKELSAYLQTLGVQVTSSSSDAKVAVFDSPVPADQQARWLTFVKQGGTLLLLGPSASKDLAWLGVTGNKQKVTAYRATVDPSWPLMAGVGQSDLFVKDKMDLELWPASGLVQWLTQPGIISRVSVGQEGQRGQVGQVGQVGQRGQGVQGGQGGEGGEGGGGGVILMAIDPRSYLQSKRSPERMDRNYRRLSRTLGLLLANKQVAFKGVGQALTRGDLPDMPLPSAWKFRIDPQNVGSSQKWNDVSFDDSSWQEIQVPGYWESHGVTQANPNVPEAKRPYDGFAWYRCRVTIPESARGKPLSLLLGAVDDLDVTYFNGQKIGQTSSQVVGACSAIRDYSIPASAIRYGQPNVVVVKVFDERGDGGIIGPQVMIHQTISDTYPYLDAKPSWNPYTLKRW